MSVIVPLYNARPYVRASLDSIVATGYPELEVVVVDDASSDGSADEVAAWAAEHPEVRLIFRRHAVNAGAPATANEAVRCTTGEFVCNSSGDDLLLPSSIEARLAYLRCHPEKLAVFSDCHVIDAEDRLVHESAIEGLGWRYGMSKRLLARDSLIPFLVFHHWGVFGPAPMFRRRAFDEIGFYDEGLQVIEDWAAYLRLAARGQLGFVDAFVGSYRIHPGQSTSKRRPLMARDVAQLARRHAPLFPGFPRLTAFALERNADYLATAPGMRRAWRRVGSLLLLITAQLLHRCLARLLWLRATLGPPRRGTA